MKHPNHSVTESGAAGLTILLVLMLVIIGVLGAVLWMRGTDSRPQPVAVESPPPRPMRRA